MPDKENKIENKDTASSEEKPQNKVEDESSQKPSKKEAPENLSDVKAKDEKLEESEGPDTKEETSSEISDIKLSGLMGTKIGMTQTIMEDGQIIPTTVVQLGPCLALEKKVKNDKTSLKVGYLDVKPSSLKKSELTYFSKLDVKPIKHIKEFDLLNPEVEIKPGTEIRANIFQPGDITDVTSKSKGKGFAGVMKKYNLKQIALMMEKLNF